MASQTRITTDHDTDKIVQFTATERNALKWADDECWDLNTESTHGFNRVLYKLSGPHKSVPFRFERSQHARRRAHRLELCRR